MLKITEDIPITLNGELDPFEQLIAQGFLRQTDDAYPVIALTAEGVALLKSADAAPGLALSRQRRRRSSNASSTSCLLDPDTECR